MSKLKATEYSLRHKSSHRPKVLVVVVKLYFVSNLRVALRALASPGYKILKLKEIITISIHSNKRTKIRLYTISTMIIK